MIFKDPFEGLIFGGVHIRREICVSKFIGLAYSWKKIYTVFALFYSVFEVNFQAQAPGGLYSEGRLNGGLFALRVWGAYIWRGVFSEFYGMSQKSRN